MSVALRGIRARSRLGAGLARSSVLRLTARGSLVTIMDQNRSNSTSQQQQQQQQSSNPQMAFPCLDKLETRTSSYEFGPEPSYAKVVSGYEVYHSSERLDLDYGGTLQEFDIAYETWGTLNSEKSNAILLHTGLSASSHARSHAKNTKPGWWEKFIGPGLSIDTDKFFVICTNVLGGCYGSTGPSSIDPADNNRYATRFPILSINDMTRAQQRLVTQHLGISKLYASVGSSMGGMQSLALASEFPDLVGRVVSISGCARSHPSSIAMRHTQRQVLMADPNWKRGFYYDGVPPHVGMKLAREIATITYRSGPEWENRFGRDRADPRKAPALCPDFLIETYLDHQGEKFCLEYDPNSLLYVSKAMDLFDLGKTNSERTRATRLVASQRAPSEDSGANSQCSLPDTPYEEQPRESAIVTGKDDLVQGMKTMSHLPTLVIGVASDILFPAWQQKEIAEVLREVSPTPELIQHLELGNDISLFGHDTFLLDVEHVGGPIKRFLES
ncbi:homoserine O-acetyltransferase [Sugiyamaella lignohabitans]|uniref:Homoserine O-acetyltransferase n=1 Tax=Sugiyamaella lignohabitans TaxID=796027 RepID=A0A167F521_9ASCO|nr:homoserine O-acetyltransferase [Sugiyamaella lignohabitans]ANB14838.1 homoserine O-acetyltransferase [Sugiyamaella lignohabitans]